MNTWERFHMYILSKDNLQINDTHTDVRNPTFNLIDSHYNKKNQY
jgi:hypothetical protein